MYLKEALIKNLISNGAPVATEYEIFRILRNLHFAKMYEGEKIRVSKHTPDRARYRTIISKLETERYLRPDPDVHPPLEDNHFSNYVSPAVATVFRISDVPDGTAEDISALIDPFCYISHISAMQKYSLTNRIPEALILSTPRNWASLRDEKIAKDYSDLEEGDYIVPLKQIGWPDTIRNRRVSLHKTVRSPIVKQVRGSFARIAAVGEVFVQMLDRPELCGGMSHVIEVWENNASIYFDDIIKAVDLAKESIIKVRAGYLLEERLNLSHPNISEWSSFAQRGGSRKLDPSAEYVSNFSEKWMLSLNV